MIEVKNSIAARRFLQGLLFLAAALATQGAWAQFSTVPTPQCKQPEPSSQNDEGAFRVDAARHVYSCFPMRVYRGKMPPLLYSVMMVETVLDATGQVMDVSVVRKPAADEVAPWIIAMIKRAAPYPAPTKLAGGTATFMETYFVDKSGLFQSQSLTEGQRQK